MSAPMPVIAVAGDEGTERQRWLAWRRQGIGGSDAATVCGLDPFRSPVSLWLEKLGRLPDREENERMRWGTLLEGVVADEFELRTGFQVVGRQTWAEHPTLPWMRATIDGFVHHPDVDEVDEADLGLYEGKCTTWHDHWGEGPPEHVRIQIQHQLAVTGLHRAWAVVLLHGNELKWFEVERDDRAIAALIDLETDFWQRVQTETLPVIDGSEVTAEALREAYAIPLGESIDLPEHAVETIAEYEAAKAAQDRAGLQKQEAANRLMAMLGDSKVGVLGGQKAISWPEIVAKDFDREALQAAHPELYAQFVTERRYRRLTVHKQKEER